MKPAAPLTFWQLHRRRQRIVGQILFGFMGLALLLGGIVLCAGFIGCLISIVSPSRPARAASAIYTITVHAPKADEWRLILVPDEHASNLLALYNRELSGLAPRGTFQSTLLDAEQHVPLLSSSGGTFDHITSPVVLSRPAGLYLAILAQEQAQTHGHALHDLRLINLTGDLTVHLEDAPVGSLTHPVYQPTPTAPLSPNLKPETSDFKL